MAELFKKERIDIEAFAAMDERALKLRGIMSKSIRKKLINAIKGSYNNNVTCINFNPLIFVSIRTDLKV